ncbi:MAG: ATP-binding protein [Bacteroidota bacterium]
MNTLKRYISLLTFLATCWGGMYGQMAQIDSLQEVLDAHPDRDTVRVMLLKEIGYRYYTIDIAETERYATEILSLSKELGFEKGQSFGHQLMGVYYSIRGEYAMALESYLIALGIQQRIGDLKGKAGILNYLEGIYFYQDDLEKALLYNAQSIEATKQLKDTLAMANGYLSRGMMQARQGDWSGAHLSYQEALALHKTQNDPPRLATVYREIGSVYAVKGNASVALDYYQKSLGINREARDLSGASHSLREIGDLHLESGAYAQALVHYRESLELAQRAGAKEHEKTALLRFSMVYERMGNGSRALSYLKQYNVLNDSLMNDARSRQLAEVELRYRTQQDRNEIALLRKEKELQEAKLDAQQSTIHTQRLIVGGAIILMVLLTILSAVYFQLNQNKKQLNQVLQEQKEELEEKSKELQALNQTKDRWFSILGDDFRYPIHFLQHALSLINEGNLNDREQEMLTQELEQRARNTGNLLDNLLYWAQGQLQELTWEPTLFPIDELLNHSIQQLSHRADRKGVLIKSNVGHKLEAFGMAETLRIAVRNLIDNAIKFSFRGGVVSVEASQGGDHVFITIIDKGIGISEENMGKLFLRNQPFTTLGTSRERGTGIGLILSQEIIEKNEGELFLDSTPGQGTTVRVYLPTKPPKARDVSSSSSSTLSQ